MQIKLLFRFVLPLLPLAVHGQTGSLRTNSPEYEWIDRLEVKTRHESFNQSFVRPLSGRQLSAAARSILHDSARFTQLTAIDRYRLQQLAGNAGSHQSGAREITINFQPVTRIEYSQESENSQHPFLLTAGSNVTGSFFNRVGFNFYATGNLERMPNYMESWLQRYDAVPGIGRFARQSNNRVSYADIRGSVHTGVTKYIDLELGYDRMFLGNGHRSLFLSDISNNMGFFKINAKVWKLNFQSLYMKLSPQDGIVNKPNHKKFLRVNTIGLEATRWLNISVFDAVVLGRRNGFDLNYVLPVSFLRAMEQQSGSPDNALFGINIKANVGRNLQFYAQGLLDEFKLDEIRAGSGWWANKFGYQLGARYVDAFGISNLDLQLETNRTRPFTYTHFDSVSNYSHANQPMAHPLGANFHEWIGIVRYQATKKLSFHSRLVYYRQGLDSLGFNMGSNVLTGYITRPRTYGWEVGSGIEASCLYFSLRSSYEVSRNAFFDATFTYRRFATAVTTTTNTTMFSLGMRWNINRREFDF